MNAGGHLLEQERNSAVIDSDGGVFQVFERLEVATAAHHVFDLGHFHDAPADIVTRFPYGLDNLADRHFEGEERHRVQLDLILLYVTTDRSDFRNAGNGGQLIAQRPILIGA